MIGLNEAVIQTASGAYVAPLEPWTWEPDVHDIAHALSNQPRFSGHTREFLSVAQHCYLVSEHVDEQHKLAALLHDASEAVLVDLPRPIKHHPSFAFYRAAERVLQTRIYHFYGIAEEPQTVRDADLRALATEVRDLMPADPADWRLLDGVEPFTQRIEPWRPQLAALMFLARFNTLYKEQTLAVAA